MRYVEIGLAFVGGVAVLLIVVTIVGAFMGNLMENRRRVLHREWHDDIRGRLRSDSWWFSEDQPTMLLIQELAECKSVDGVRERWRKRRAEQRKDGATC